MDSTYQETLDYLYSFVDYSLTHNFPAPENFDLERLRTFLAEFGNPHLAAPVIHVAGTKGKGSVASMCASALQKAGYRVGLYTSPHLSDYAERIKLGNEPISHAALIALVDELRPYLDRGTKLTTFEITTALAFLYFARQGANVVVAEVGLGGRLDATNVVTPLVSVITSISYDHTSVLGNTLAEIAGEKAGIIKYRVPVVMAPQLEEAQEVIFDIASKLEAPLIAVGRNYQFKLIGHTIQGQSFLIWSMPESPLVENYHDGDMVAGLEPVSLQIPLLGSHQVENAATAYAVLKTANSRGLQIDDRAIKEGFAEVNWPGRFELLQVEPPVVVDSAHNRDSAHKLALTLDEYFPGRKVILVFGASHDKDIHGMLAELLPKVSRIIFTRSYHPRAIDPNSLADEASEFNGPIHQVAEIQDGFNLALEFLNEQSMVLVTGSIFIAAGARDTWYNQLSVDADNMD